MKATIDNLTTAINTNFRREKDFRREIAVLDPKSGRAIVTARIYGTDRAAYACIWIASDYGLRGSGSGRATGYGYHRASAALDSAIRGAGVTLSEPIDGRGDAAMVTACEAIAHASVGRRRLIAHDAHG